MLGISVGGGKAMKLLKKDHDKVKDLFDRFEAAEDGAERKLIVREACEELKVHARVEEELFYPALRQRLNDKPGGLLDEADEEHHGVKILIAELELMRGDENNFAAKFMVLAENVRHHIQEEENEVFPAARKTSIDFDALGERMEKRKLELMKEGVPADPEAVMVKGFGLAPESPSRKAMRTLILPEGGRARKH